MRFPAHTFCALAGRYHPAISATIPAITLALAPLPVGKLHTAGREQTSPGSWDSARAQTTLF
jgi:hypothetical protein